MLNLKAHCSRRVRFFFKAYSAVAKLRWFMGG